MSRAERVLHPSRSALDRFGFELRQLRKDRGYSLAGLAGLVFVSADLLQKIELAERSPNRDLTERLDSALRAEGALLERWQAVSAERRARDVVCACASAHGSVRECPHENVVSVASFAGIDDVNRRELLRIMSIAGAITAAGSFHDDLDWTRLGSFAGGESNLDSQMVDDFATLNEHLWRVFVLSRTKYAVFPLVRDHLDVLVSGLPRAGRVAGYRRLCGFASSAFQLCGEILFDANQYTEAAHCYALAATAGKESGLNDLWACALTRHAFIGLYERRVDSAVPLLELAARLARHGDGTLATRHWVAVVQAQAFAGLGDLTACQRALDVAAEVRGLTGEYQNGGWLRFDGSRLAEERGTCYLQLGRFDLAESALTSALGQNLSVRRRGGVLTDLAILGLRRSDLDKAVAYADAAAEIVAQTRSGVITRKLKGLQSELSPFLNDIRVRNLNARIDAFESLAAAGQITGGSAHA
jgi:tetratricopeptide (TPR) repeat protein